MTNDHSSDYQETLDSLGAIRNRLLDMSRRNTLLHFGITNKRNKRLIRIVDYSLSSLSKQLIEDEASFIFKSVPEPSKEDYAHTGVRSGRANESSEIDKSGKKPTPEVWAQELGIDTSFSLPLTPHEGRKKRELRTLFYAKELENQLHRISKVRDNEIQETGMNSLYLACGFLEWYETEDSDVVCHAPLYLVPVALTKNTLDQETQTYTYSMSWSNDDIHTNVSLQEKLRLEFGFQVPDVDEMSAQEYLERLDDLLSKQDKHPVMKRWSVKSFAAVSFFNFMRIAMYHDLDPKRWPKGQEIEEHPVIKRFLSSSELDSHVTSYQKEYPIDRIDKIHSLFPLIDDADSSQHSALIEVLKGNNLVIEGPPGTGKSQTITNIVAALLSHGKKVLFVSAKQAALDVVHNRLERNDLAAR